MGYRFESPLIEFNMYQPLVGRDGMTYDFSQRLYDASCGVNFFTACTIWDDPDWDGVSSDSALLPPVDVLPIVSGCDLPQQSSLAAGHAVAELASAGIAPPGARLTFRDFGEFPEGEAFTFRYGGLSCESVWISPNGVVGFGLPARGPATPASLQSQPGLIAPCWSDTSKVEVMAGYAPIQKSFVTGERVLAFTIEWRGLRLPDWEQDRRISARLVLLSDGSFRTDYGAFEASELGGFAFVTGYSGPGAHARTSPTSDTSG